MTAPSSGSRFRLVKRQCEAGDVPRIRVKLTHAREAGLLTSFDEGAVIYDGQGVLVMLDALLMPSVLRGEFALEEETATRAIDRVLATHSASDRPPRYP